jgi:hypothetical protein
MVPAARARIVWRPQRGPQHAFIKCPVFEVVYGGARGGGKTDAALGEWALHAKRYGEHAKGLFVRRTRVALEPTIERAKQVFVPLGATWQEQKSRFGGDPVFPLPRQGRGRRQLPGPRLHPRLCGGTDTVPEQRPG